MAKQIVTLTFMGERISLKSDNDTDLIQDIVDLATIKLSDAEKRASGSPSHQVALLAVLDIAEEYIRAKRRAADHRKVLAEKSERLIQLVQDHNP